MYSPTQILKDCSTIVTRSKTQNKFNLDDYIRQTLDSVGPTIIPSSSSNSKFKPLILKLINSYQIYNRLEIGKLKIIPFKSKFENLKIPKSPTALTEIPEYAYKLTSLPDFELSPESKKLKSSLFKSLVIEDSQLLELDNENNDLIKSIIIDLIIHSDSNFEKYFSLIGFDVDVYYIICFQYFLNPFKLDKFSKLNYTCKLLAIFKDLKIHENDWKFFQSMINSNIYSFKTGESNKNSALFDNMITIVNQINDNYYKFDLVGMLRILRNAETGFEVYNQDGMSHEVIKYHIKYYRFLIINNAIIEWNNKSLTKNTWEKYDFQKQWTTVWEIYYNNKNILPPGGPTFKKKVKAIVNDI